MMSASPKYADWIAVDWGTSRLRAWAMQGVDTVLSYASSDDGMGTLTQPKFEPALLRLIEPWLGAGHINVVACGMVGSRQGWTEAAYVPVPCKPGLARLHPVLTLDPRISLSILPGVSQASPPDVMRGEETQIAGFLHKFPNFDGVLCLPGTHTKWVHLRAAEIVSFQTFMTGEMFALLATQSVLRHSVDPDHHTPDLFLEAVSDSLSRPERIAQRLFSLRANGLLNGPDPQAARARLSGSLIGLELAGARPYWLGQQVVIAGTPALAALYETALAAQGVPVECYAAGDLTRAGLASAYASLTEIAV